MPPLVRGGGFCEVKDGGVVLYSLPQSKPTILPAPSSEGATSVIIL